ncbi:MAG: VCBS repeat-containing protein [Planctomycetes bacterium]|nr:VCBS repeat-containing protein [Planctomycetota bacterium]
MILRSVTTRTVSVFLLAFLCADSLAAQQVRATPAGGRRAWPQPAPSCPSPRFAFQALPTGSGPSEVAVGDMDRDGDLDLVCAVYDEDRIEVFLNQGNGQFGNALPHPAGDGPRALSLSDVDRDGHLDVLVLARTASDVLVLRNSGSGAIASTQVYDLASFNPNDLAVGDVDNDGDDDFVAPASSGRVRAFLNDGAGNFPTSSDVFGTGTVEALLLTDLDGDSDLDLVTNRSGSPASIGLHENLGGGVFGPVLAIPTIGTTGRMEAVDMDGDGDPDLVCGSAASAPNPGVVLVLLNGGSFSFGAVQSFPTGATPYHLAAGDLDRDGDVDILTGDAGAGTVSVLRNDGTGALSLPENYPTGGEPWDVDVADLDGDGGLDVAVADLDGRNVTLLIQREPGQFYWPETIPTLSGTGATLLKDFTGDGLIDIVRTRLASGPSFAVQRGLGAGRFAPPVEFPSNFSGPGPLQGISMAAQDFDGDGDLDLGILEQGFLHQHENLGGGNFGLPVSVATGGARNDVVAADLDGDGDRDLVLFLLSSAGQGSRVYVSERTPSGYQPPVEHWLPGYVDALAVADHDGDGPLDLIVSISASPAGVLMLRNLGGLAFGPATYIFSIPVNGSPNTRITDLDGDGDLDYAMGSAGVVLTLGPSWVSAPSPFPIQSFGGRPSAADVDADGDLDLIYPRTVQFTSVVVQRIHRNHGGVFTPSESFAGITATGTFADVDGDGDADLVHSNAAGLTLLRNRCH